MAHTEYPPHNHNAQAAKQAGNEFFRNKLWPEAIGAYTAAHMADPTEPTYPLNRAMAYIKLGKFVDAERDCTTALLLSPNNVKALYRRASARLCATSLPNNLALAIHDLEAVLRLDPTNPDAKAALTKARQAVDAAKPNTTDPIHLQHLTNPPDSVPRKSTTQVDLPASKVNTASTESSSCVEAARNFLQHVGMSHQAERSQTTSTSQASTSSVPAKFPGETGGLLRPVTTRRTTAKPIAPQDDPITHTPATSVSTPVTHPNQTVLNKTVCASTRSIRTSVENTASALNFGASAAQTTAAQTTAASFAHQPTPRTHKAPHKITAIEFHRRWKNKRERLALLSSLDPESIPRMMDAMLEPQLVAEILQTLAQAKRCSPQHGHLTSLVAAILAALARCKRFGMTVSMLDASEKQDAAYLIDAIRSHDLKRVWEVA